MAEARDKPSERGSPEAGTPRSFALRSNRDFQIVLAGQAVSAFGDAISLTAMPLLVLLLTGSGALMGVVGALQVLPDLALGLPAGALADRLDRRRMMMWADGGRAALTAAIPLSFALGGPTIAVILVVAVPINLLRVLSDAAYTSAIPSLVGREHLARANSVLEATLSVPYIAGPALSGVLVATVGPAATIAIDAGTFALSAVSLAFVQRSLRAVRSSEPPHIVADITEGLSFVARHPMLRGIIAYWSVMTITTAGVIPALAYSITVDRSLGAALFGFVGSAWSLGYLIGSLAAGRLGGGRMGLALVGTGIGIGALVVVLGIARDPAAYLAAGFGVGAALAVQLISYATLRASVTPDDLMGRVGSTARVISVGLQPIGLLIGGAIIELAGGGTALVAMGLAALAGSVLFALSRTVRTAGLST